MGEEKMDYTLPVAKRTRSREAQMFRKIYEAMKGKDGGSNAGNSEGFSGSREINSREKGSASGSGSTSFSERRKGKGKKIMKERKKKMKKKGNGYGKLKLGGGNFDEFRRNDRYDDDVEKIDLLSSDSDSDDTGSPSGKKLSHREKKDKVQENSDDDIIEVFSDSKSDDGDDVEEEEERDDDEDYDEDYNAETPSASDEESSSSGNDEDEDEGDSKDSGSGSGYKGRQRVVYDSDDSVVDKGRQRVVYDSDDSVVDITDDFKDSGSGSVSVSSSKQRGSPNLLKSSKKRRTRSHTSSVEDDSDKRQHKKKRIRAYSDEDVVNILGNSIFDKDELLWEEPVVVEPVLLRIYFGPDEESVTPEKPEDDEELAPLWAEMALALYANGDTQSGESEADVSPEIEPGKAVLCYQGGDHQFILDEEIGVKCKHCSFVQMEIKQWSAPFGKQSLGNAERRGHYVERLNILDELCDQDCHHDHAYDSFRNVQGTVWSIVPGIGKDLHEHQREGFEFLWKNIAGGIQLDELKEPTRFDGGSGCIISHAPGTGKTRLAIIFLQSYMKLYPTCRPMIIAPTSMLLSWEAEFKKWNVDIPFHNLHEAKFCGKENAAALRLVKSRPTVNSARMVKLYSWKNDKSILGISYKLFEELVTEENKRSKAGHKSGNNMRKALLELPGLLVLDEGHTPRNEGSLIFKALSRIRTDKRIILSGTPFQNNFVELYNILLLVRPKFADLLSCNSNGLFAKKKRGRRLSAARLTWASLTSSIGKDGNERLKAENLEEIRAMIKPFVHVHKGNILRQRLPGLRDAVVILRPVGLQKEVLAKVQGTQQQNLDFEYQETVVSVHPSLLRPNLQEVAGFGSLSKYRKNPDMGIKTKFLVELLWLSGKMNERVLVFSQYRKPLELILEQLESQFCWAEGKEILHMHGQIDAVQRHSQIKHFNDKKSEAKVMLASTKACSEGINLVGASRVVLLDVVWNPSVERQAISRAYRLGQEKVVHVYHLIASGTLEEEKYCRQAEKERLSELVFYSSDRTHDFQKPNVSDDQKDNLLESIVQRQKLKDILERIIYQPKDSMFEGLLNL